jgi:hypothetical protein
MRKWRVDEFQILSITAIPAAPLRKRRAKALTKDFQSLEISIAAPSDEEEDCLTNGTMLFTIPFLGKKMCEALWFSPISQTSVLSQKNYYHYQLIRVMLQVSLMSFQ